MLKRRRTKYEYLHSFCCFGEPHAAQKASQHRRGFDFLRHSCVSSGCPPRGVVCTGNGLRLTMKMPVTARGQGSDILVHHGIQASPGKPSARQLLSGCSRTLRIHQAWVQANPRNGWLEHRGWCLRASKGSTQRTTNKVLRCSHKRSLQIRLRETHGQVSTTFLRQPASRILRTAEGMV